MNKHRIILLSCVLLWSLIGFFGCGEEKASAPQPTQSVSKKIAAPTAPPVSTPVVQVEKAPEPVPPAAQVAAGSEPGPAPVATPPVVAVQPSELVKESLQIASSYDPADRFDPFEPLFKEQSAQAEVKSAKGKKDKRAPQTPLERVALSQLKVTAIIRAPSGNRAMVEDATGKGYVVQKGTYIGLNSGQVVQIDRDRIVVEEEVENVMGELTIQNAELKLQKPAGEL